MEKQETTEITAKVKSDLFTEKTPHQIFSLLDRYWPAKDQLTKHGGAHKLRKMYDTDDEIAGAIDTRQEACVSTPWTLEGGQDDVKDLLWEFINPFVADLISYSWWAVPFGYSVTQVVYDEEFYNETGLIKPQCILDQPFEEFEPLRNGMLAKKTFLRSSIKDHLVTPPEKYIHVVRKPSYHCPQGEPLFTRLYYAWIYRCHGWEYFMEYLEKWANPFIHAQASGAGETLNHINELLGATKRPTAITTDVETKIDIKSPSSNSGPLFELMNRGTSERIHRLILGQTLTSGTSGVGSQALGTIHNEVRQDKRRSDCKLVSQAVQKLVNYLYNLNGMKGDIPLFKMNDPQGLEIQRAERDAILSTQVGIQFTKKYMIERYDFEEEDIEVIQKDVALSDVSFDNHSHDLFKFMSSEGLNPRQKASFDLETEAIKESGDLIDPDEMQALIRASKSSKDLEKKLEAFVAREDPKFMDVLTRALYLSQLKGYVDGKEKVENG